VVADVVHVHEDQRPGRSCTVLDFGYRAFRQRLLVLADGRPVRVGDRVRGVLSVSVDPFFYVDEIAVQRPDVPALLHRWRIDGIAIDESPLLRIEPGDARFPPYLPPGEGPVLVRDRERESWRPVRRTRTWGARADGDVTYRLDCVGTGEPPRRPAAP
jgi:hypothetical protein